MHNVYLLTLSYWIDQGCFKAKDMLSFKVQNYNCLSVKLLYFKPLVINVLHVSEIYAGKIVVWFCFIKEFTIWISVLLIVVLDLFIEKSQDWILRTRVNWTFSLSREIARYWSCQIISLHIRSMWETICDAWACWSGWNFWSKFYRIPLFWNTVSEYPPPHPENENCQRSWHFDFSVSEYPPSPSPPQKKLKFRQILAL